MYANTIILRNIKANKHTKVTSIFLLTILYLTNRYRKESKLHTHKKGTIILYIKSMISRSNSFIFDIPEETFKPEKVSFGIDLFGTGEILQKLEKAYHCRSSQLQKWCS